MTFRGLSACLTLPLVAACATAVPPNQRPAAPPPTRIEVPPQVPPSQPPPPPVEGFRTPEILDTPGLGFVIRQDAQALTNTFGLPRLDVAEGDMRKLQFTGEPCVLDVFLYPLRPGAEPVATHVEARRASDGAEVDRRACAEALRR